MSLIKEFLNPIADFFGIPWWYVLLTASLVILAFRTSRTYFKTEKSDDQGLKGFLGFLRRLSSVYRDYYHWGLLRCLRCPGQVGWGNHCTELHQSRCSFPRMDRTLARAVIPGRGGLYDSLLKISAASIRYWRY